MNPLLMIPLLTATGLASFWLFYKSVDFFDNILLPRAMMLALFALSLAVFGYLVYVLLKPERF